MLEALLDSFDLGTSFALRNRHITSETSASNALPFYSKLLMQRTNGQTTEAKTRMPMAFVLINAEIGSEDAVVKELKAVSNVKEAYMVYGVYDIVAKVAADSMDKLKEIITWKIRRLNKVKSTLTMIVIEN
jgi:DNA-binding Lrp family transcriptional regulator